MSTSTPEPNELFLGARSQHLRQRGNRRCFLDRDSPVVISPSAKQFLWVSAGNYGLKRASSTLFNNVNLSNPDTNVQDKSVGVIPSDDQVPREMQLGLVFTF